MTNHDMIATAVKKYRGTIMSSLIYVLLAVSGMALLVGNAKAELNMQQRENVQTIVWVFEFVTFLTAMAIVWFVWRMIKQDSENKKSKQNNS
jgi:threonine/homoserine/homoserine lactone efflux protein